MPLRARTDIFNVGAGAYDSPPLMENVLAGRRGAAPYKQRFKCRGGNLPPANVS